MTDSTIKSNLDKLVEANVNFKNHLNDLSFELEFF